MDREPARAKPEYSSMVPAVEQASRILLALAQAPDGKSSLTDICSSVGIHKSKGYSILRTLQQFALVQKSQRDKTYSLGPCLLFLSSKVLNNLDLREEVAPVLRGLAHETNSTAFLGLVSDKHVFVVARDEGSQDIGVTIRLGHRFPLAWGAHGKSIVAFLPDSEREKLLGTSKLYFHGTPSRIDVHRLEQELAECRQKGYALDLEDMKTGIRAAAAPVFAVGGKLIGSLAIVGTFTEKAAKRYGPKVAAAAKEFSESIGCVPSVALDGTTPGGA